MRKKASPRSAKNASRYGPGNNERSRRPGKPTPPWSRALTLKALDLRGIVIDVKLPEPLPILQDRPVPIAQDRLLPILLVIPHDQIHRLEPSRLLAVRLADHVVHQVLRDLRLLGPLGILLVRKTHVHLRFFQRDRHSVADHRAGNTLRIEPEYRQTGPLLIPHR